MRPSHRVQGMTLIELMMVVVIIAGSVLVFAPSIRRAMADRSLALAANELVRIGREGYAETRGLARSHLMWFRPQNRRVVLLRGTTGGCTFQGWNAIAAQCDADPPDQDCIENLELDQGRWRSNEYPISLLEVLPDATPSNADNPTGTAQLAICFAASGATFWARPNGDLDAGPYTDLNVAGGMSLGGGFVYRVRAPELPARDVFFPLGATPRVVR